MAQFGEPQALSPMGINQVPLHNENYKVNIDQGCHIRFHETGAAVYHFPSKPGHFYNEHGKPVTSQFAQEAGFDTEELLRLRARNEARAKADAQIDAEFNMAPEREVVDEQGDYRLVHLGKGRYNIEFTEDGSVVNTRGALTEDIAKKTFYVSLLNREIPTPKSVPEPATQNKNK